MFEAWFNHLVSKVNYVGGRWRQTDIAKPVQKLKDFGKKQQTPGKLVLVDKQYNLYLQKEDGIDIEFFVSLVKNHPLSAFGDWQADKPTGQYNDEGVWFPAKHLSKANYRMRTKLNFGLILGYSDHLDAQNICHLWMRLTSGPLAKHEKHMKVMANFLCELARHEMPFPMQFAREGFFFCRPLAA